MSSFRSLMLSMSAIAASSVTGCFKTIDQKRAEHGMIPLSEEEKVVMERLSAFGGCQLRFDAFGEKSYVNFFDDQMRLYFNSAVLGDRGAAKLSHSRLLGVPVPVRLRVRWRDRTLPLNEIDRKKIDTFESRHPTAYYGGNILGDHTVEVASRIPQDLIDDYPYYAKQRMGLHIKFRVHDQGVLVGWHLGNMFDRVHVGGDFEERNVQQVAIGGNNWSAKQFNEGWYIHPVTKERITTPF